MKTKEFLFFIYALIGLNSCQYIDSLKAEDPYTIVQNTIEQDAYKPYSTYTRKGYYCNDSYPNDVILTDSYQIASDGTYSMDLSGRWKVVAGWNYTKSGDNATKSNINYSGRGFVINSKIEDEKKFFINKTILNLNNSTIYNESYPSNKFKVNCTSNYNLNTKFGQMNINSEFENDKLFIVDVNQSVTKMVVQTSDYNEDVTFDMNFQRYLLIKQ